MICTTAFSQSSTGSLRKAANAVERGNYERAIEKYLATLKEDSLNFKANTEYGLLLIEYLNDPGKAGAYLLRAEKISKKDTMAEVIYGLAKYYHYQNEYSKAITYYKKILTRLDSSEDDGGLLLKEIKRGIENCKYALKNSATVAIRIKINNLGDGVCIQTNLNFHS